MGRLCLYVALLLGAAVSSARAEGLTVSGSSLLWSGSAVRIRGVAVGDPLLAREDRPLSDYTRIARKWNANAVRIGYHPSVWKHQAHAPLLDRLETEVNAAVSEGMFVIIDWHTIGWPDGYFEAPDPKWGDPEDLYDSSFAVAKDYWGAIAQRFGTNPRVLFEVWNEPVFSEDEGGPDSPPKWSQLKPKWAELVSLIRTSSTNVILVTGNEWAYDLRGVKDSLLSGTNIAYTWHVYAGNGENHPGNWSKHLDDLEKVAPVIVTEWGFQRGSPEHFRGTPQNFGIPFARDFLEARALHNTAWCWHSDWTPNMLRRDWETPTEFGRFVRSYLRNPLGKFWSDF